MIQLSASLQSVKEPPKSHNEVQNVINLPAQRCSCNCNSNSNSKLQLTTKESRQCWLSLQQEKCKKSVGKLCRNAKPNGSFPPSRGVGFRLACLPTWLHATRRTTQCHELQISQATEQKNAPTMDHGRQSKQDLRTIGA